MSYYTTWIEKSENNSNEQEYIEYVNRYYTLEGSILSHNQNEGNDFWHMKDPPTY